MEVKRFYRGSCDFETMVYREPLPGIEVQIRVRGRYYPGTPSTYYNPPEPSQLDIEECCIVDDSGKVLDPMVELTETELYDVTLDAECDYKDSCQGPEYDKYLHKEF